MLADKSKSKFLYHFWEPDYKVSPLKQTEKNTIYRASLNAKAFLKKVTSLKLLNGNVQLYINGLVVDRY